MFKVSLTVMNTFMTPLGLAEEARFRVFAHNIQTADVRIHDTFCYDRDMRGVEGGSVVYPDQLALDQSPRLIATGSIVIALAENDQVLSVDIP